MNFDDLNFETADLDASVLARIKFSCHNCLVPRENRPSTRLMINVCNHTLCDTCVRQNYFRGSGKCLVCRRMLALQNFKYLEFPKSEASEHRE
jgi:hypothetical protein